MKKLNKYAEKSELMAVSITYGSEKFSFNLFSELVVDENKINYEAKVQPSAYAFLGMLHKKLIRRAKDKEREMDKTYATMYIKFKEKIDERTGRPTANELAKERAIASSRYQTSWKEYIEANHDANIIGVCVSSFEQRKDLIQTLSANIRKTN